MVGALKDSSSECLGSGVLKVPIHLGLCVLGKHCGEFPANITSSHRNPSTSSTLNPQTEISKDDFSQLCHPSGI